MNNAKVASELLNLAKTLVAGCENLPEGGMRDNCEKKKEEGKEASERVAASTDAKDVQKMAKGAATEGKSIELNLNAVVKALSSGDKKKVADSVENAIAGMEKAVNYLKKDMARLKELK